MLNRTTIATFFALLVGLFAVGTATAASPSDRDPIPPPTDYWQDKGFILMAHQGGEWDFPPNTMYAYKQAMALGADMLDMDAYVTQDGHVVLSHDLDASDNSDAPLDTDINTLTLAQLKAFDFAFKWTPHGGSGDPFRGVATGAVPPPTGFTADDFKIPTFNEVLDEFPDTPINIELKAVPGVNEQDTVNAVAAVLDANPGHNENVIINSFGQSMLEKMHATQPEHLSFSGSLSGSVSYIQGNPIVPTPVAIEPPDLFNLPPVVRTVPILKPWADHDGYRIFVWGSDDDPTQDTPPFYAKLIEEGADSYNTPSPTTLATYLCENGIARPDGTPRCAEQICPEGQTGIAPDNCVDIACPTGQVGTPPDCVDPPECLAPETGTPPNCVEIAPKARLKILSISVPKPLKSGKKAKLAVKIKNTGDAPLRGIKSCLKLKGKVKGKIKMGPCGKTASLGANKTVRQYLSVTYKAKQGKTGSAKSLRASVAKATQGKTGRAKSSLRVTTNNGGSVQRDVVLLYKAKAGKTGSASGK